MMTEHIPENWTAKPLKEITDFVIGGDWGEPTTSTNGNYKEVLCIRGSDFKHWNIHKGANALSRFVKSASFEKRKLIAGDIIIEISGGGPDQPVGRVILFDEEAAKKLGIEKVCSNFLRLLRLSDSVSKAYVFYYLQFLYITGEVVKYQGGSNNLRNLKYPAYSGIKIPLPPIEEQKQISDILDRAFQHIEVLKPKLDYFLERITKFRRTVVAYGISGKFIDDSFDANIIPITIGHINNNAPPGWKWTKLTTIAKLESGHTPRKSVDAYWDNGNIPWISLQDIRLAHGKIISETKLMTNEKGIANSSARILPKGTVCLSRDISVGFTTVMGREMATSQHFANWICGECIHNMYLLYAFMASRYSLIASSTGTTVGSIYMPALKDMYILLPPIDVQYSIAKKIEDLLKIAQDMENQYQSVKTKVDKIPLALLTKTFNGKLV
ncbi:restriction endonuclease subunit S [Mucilaginibacter aquariorum]|uniref:Restriction endonuclease subunit S n=1 Tax=Mucilaginibacter aquariorum TaxID=2967225 RepID=A0ABT1T117_9SPHI|nr:restriction endonuclease subunit S [Mucilaginibacter aquariorum]MCQ6958300.1 restriction endonuclease subunit S [Mucilaginibacter aquariorum]